MKPVKLIATTALLSMMAFSATVFTSCKQEDDKCDNSICLNGGTCDDGRCNCPSGYEGANCQTTWGSKFTSTSWYGTLKYTQFGTERTEASQLSFQTTLIPNVIVFHLGLIGSSSGAICDMPSPNSFKIRDNQLISEGSGYKTTIRSGSGSLDDLGVNLTGTFVIEYTSPSSSNVITMSFAMRKM